MPPKRNGSRKAEIADAILKVAGKEGIAALTMERLARELGVTSGALFRHFPSRTSMLNEAARLAVTRLDQTFPESSLPPLERLRQFLAARSRLAAEHGAIPQLVFSEQFGKSLPPKGSRGVREAVLRTRRFVIEALREAATRGEIRQDIPAQELALTVIGTVFARSLFAALETGEDGAAHADGRRRWDNLARLLGASAPPPAETTVATSSRPLSTEGVEP